MNERQGNLVSSLDLFLLVYGNPLYLNSKGKKLTRICFFSFFIFRLIVSFVFWPTTGVKADVSTHSPLNITVVVHFVQLFSCGYFYFWLITRRKDISKFFVTISSIIPTKYCIHSHLRRRLNHQSTVVVLTSVTLLILNCLSYSYFAHSTDTFGQSHIFQRLMMNKSPRANVTLIEFTAAVSLYMYDLCFDTYFVVAMAIFVIAYLAKSAALESSLVYFTASINSGRKVSVRAGHVKTVWLLNRHFEQLFSTLPLICTLTSLSTAIAYILGDESLFSRFFNLPWHLALAFVPLTVVYCSYPLAVLFYLTGRHEQLVDLAQEKYLEMLERVESSCEALMLKDLIKHIKSKSTVAGFSKIDRSFIATTISTFLAMGVMLVQLIK